MKSQDGKAECLHCGGEFWPRRRGHVFCSNFCRHRGERWNRPTRADHEAIARLLDPSRDPNERVREDDWHPTPDSADGAVWRVLDSSHTVGQRRRWYRNLVADGLLEQ